MDRHLFGLYIVAKGLKLDPMPKMFQDKVQKQATLFNWGERSEPRIGEVNANSVCMYVIDRPTGRIAHAQKHAKHML